MEAGVNPCHGFTIPLSGRKRQAGKGRFRVQSAWNRGKSEFPTSYVITSTGGEEGWGGGFFRTSLASMSVD